MAALNAECFKKKCQCASCRHICPWCFVDDDSCMKGVSTCKRYVKMDYASYESKYYGARPVSEKIYEEGSAF